VAIITGIEPPHKTPDRPREVHHVATQPIDIDSILDRYPPEERYLIALLQDVQAAYSYIPPEAMQLICDHVGVPQTRAWAVATFYSSFSLEPKGEHIIQVCLGTACHLKGSGRLAENMMRDLGVEAGHTTSDLKFTLETVNCLGACALAPVAVIDGKYEPRVSSTKMRRLVKKLDQD
jgi:NADH-quinone oxidoreductase subunit E